MRLDDIGKFIFVRLLVCHLTRLQLYKDGRKTHYTRPVAKGGRGGCTPPSPPGTKGPDLGTEGPTFSVNEMNE